LAVQSSAVLHDPQPTHESSSSSPPSPSPAVEPPLAYAAGGKSPWPMLVRFVATFGLALGASTVVRMLVDTAGAFGLIDAPSLLASQARHPGWAVWVLFFLLVTALLHAILVVGSLLAIFLRPESLKYLHTYAVASSAFVVIGVLVNFGYFLWAPSLNQYRPYFLTIFLVNGINNLAFPLATLFLLRCPPFVAVLEGRLPAVQRSDANKVVLLMAPDLPVHSEIMPGAR
jgi:hypothetical protein